MKDEEKVIRCQIFWAWDTWPRSGNPGKSIEQVSALLQTMIVKEEGC